MEFVIVASLMVIIAIVIGAVTNKQTMDEIKDNCLYDKDTVSIMKRYKLINDEECRLMLDKLKKEKEI